MLHARSFVRRICEPRMCVCPQAYVMVTTALLMVYCVTPFSAAGVSARAPGLSQYASIPPPTQAIVRLRPCADDNSFFALLEKFQKTIGAHVLEVVDNLTARPIMLMWLGGCICRRDHCPLCCGRCFGSCSPSPQPCRDT